ncbi:ABC transporter substrate-binding protein [Nocardioidaceae bacterium SCSIO 66511]|nr:ABC transporter substrate-binding protein [Nocardioidaceae bacterium SCSIO 66511]
MSHSWIKRLVVALAVMAAIVVAGRVYDTKDGAAAADSIRIGWVPAASWTPWATLDTELPDGTSVELVPFKSSNDELTALTQGSIDMAPVGYNNLAALLTTSDPPVSFVSGISSNGSVFLARKGSGIDTWQDLRGKRIASVRGSTQYVNMATAMKSQGLDIDSDTTYVNMQAFPDLNLALDRGDVDAIVTFPPLSGEAIDGGHATTVDDIQSHLYDGSFTVASGILANDSFLEDNREEAETVLEAYRARLADLSKDPHEWAAQYEREAGSKGARIAEALEREYIKPEPDMPMSEIMKVPTVLSQMNIIDSDTSEQLAEHIDYSLLEDITGEPASRLGKND